MFSGRQSVLVASTSTAAAEAAQAATSGVLGYSVDSLFRSDHVDASASNQDVAPFQPTPVG